MAIKVPNLYFLHIPKTSGTSLYNSFYSIFNRDQYNQWLTWFHIAKQINRNDLISDLYSSDLPFISGHFGWNKKIIKNRFVFTMFRNPVYRTISQLQHIKKSPLENAWVDERFIIDERNLISPLYNREFAKYVSNVQTKYLLSSFDPSEDIINLPIGTNYFWDQDSRFLSSINLPSAVIVPKILNRLLRLDFFGLNMLHSESLFMLSSILNMELKEVDTREVVNSPTVNIIPSESYPLTPESLVLLESVNTYDSILFDFAKRIFIKRWMNFFNKRFHMNIRFDEYIQNRIKYLEMLRNKG